MKPAVASIRRAGWGLVLIAAILIAVVVYVWLTRGIAHMTGQDAEQTGTFTGAGIVLAFIGMLMTQYHGRTPKKTNNIK